MPLLDGVYHEIPEQTKCKNCHKLTKPEYWKDFTVEGKFLVFAALCKACRAVNFHFAGDDEHVQKFRQAMKKPTKNPTECLA